MAKKLNEMTTTGLIRKVKKLEAKLAEITREKDLLLAANDCLQERCTGLEENLQNRMTEIDGTKTIIKNMEEDLNEWKQALNDKLTIIKNMEDELEKAKREREGAIAQKDMETTRLKTLISRMEFKLRALIEAGILNVRDLFLIDLHDPDKKKIIVETVGEPWCCVIK